MTEGSIEVTRAVLDEETQRATVPAHPARDDFRRERALVAVPLSREDGHAFRRAIGPKRRREPGRKSIEAREARVPPIRLQWSRSSPSPTPDASTPTYAMPTKIDPASGVIRSS